MLIKLHAEVVSNKPTDSYEKVKQELKLVDPDEKEKEYVPILVNPQDFVMVTGYKNHCTVELAYPVEDENGAYRLKAFRVRESMDEIENML